MLRTVASVVGILVLSLPLGGCSFDLGSEPSYYMYTDMLTPPGASVMVWPADEAAQRFRYAATSDMGSVIGPRIVREIGLPPDASFAHYLPKETRGITVLLPAERLAELRPRAQLLLDSAAALRPELATSITPVAAEALERPLVEIQDAAELDAALERALHEHRMRRPESFSDAFASLYWMPSLIVWPLEPEPDGPAGGRFALLAENHIDSATLEEPAERRVDWEELVAAVEGRGAQNEQGFVSAWVIEPAGASEAVRAEVGRLMDWFGTLEGDLTVWQRVPLEDEIPPDASVERVLQVLANSAYEPSGVGRVEVRLRYDVARFEPNFRGQLIAR